MSNNSHLLTFVPYSKFSQWDVKQFFFEKIASPFPIEKLGKHLIHQTEKVQLSDYPETEFGILGVSNKIGMFDADTVKGKSVSQKYHVVKDNWLAYNPYRINVGSIGLKTSEQKGGYISPAYVVFSCKDTLLPEYMWLLMKTDTFNSIIKDSTTGSVRQTLHFEKLADISAPIPSVPEQQKILDKYHKLIKHAQQLVKDADEALRQSLIDIQSQVSTYKCGMDEMSKKDSLLDIVSFTSTKRWEVDYIYKESRIDAVVDSFTYPANNIDSLQKEFLFGLSVKASLDKKTGMIPVLRMSNIKNGNIDFDELKYLPYECAVTDKEPQKWLLEKGDFLVTRTNGSKDLVGKAAVFNGDDVYTYASYLIRYRFDTNVVFPEYVNIMFMTALVREQIAVMRRQGGGQYNLNSGEINSIQIPLPPKDVQKDIINQFFKTRSLENELKCQAQQCVEEAVDYLENVLFSR